MRYRGKVFTADNIIDRIWKELESPAPEVIRTHIMNLRRKLSGDVIETVRGVGHKIADNSSKCDGITRSPSRSEDDAGKIRFADKRLDHFAR